MSNSGKRYARYTTSVKLGFDPVVVAALNARSMRTQRSVASLIREAVDQYLRDVPATPDVLDPLLIDPPPATRP